MKTKRVEYILLNEVKAHPTLADVTDQSTLPLQNLGNRLDAMWHLMNCSFD